MIKQIYECTLLSDVILNQTSATEGEMESLDFIPGNTFLGIAAGALYGKLKPQEAATVFHSGKVRFGDAHPWKDGIRSLKVPAALFYNKLGSPEVKLTPAFFSACFTSDNLSAKPISFHALRI